MKALLLVVFVNFVGIGALIPVVPFAVIDVAGGNETLMAWLLASYVLAMFIGAPVLGSLSDLYGRKAILVASILVEAMAHAAFALTSDLALMFAARTVAGLAAGNVSVIRAIITDSTGEADRARAMGLLGVFVGLGFVAGPAIGGLLSGVAGQVHTAPFLLASGLAFTGGVICMASVRETVVRAPEAEGTPPLTARLRAVMARGLAGFALAAFLFNFCFAQLEVSFILALKDVLGYTSVETGWVFVWIGLLVVVVQGGLIGPVAKRLTDLGTALAGSIVLAAGLLATAALIGLEFVFMGSAVAGVLFSSGVVCVGAGLVNPTLFSAASMRAREGHIGGGLGIIQGCASLGHVGGLLVAGPLYRIGGGELNHVVAAAVSLAHAACFLSIMLSGRRARPS